MEPVFKFPQLSLHSYLQPLRLSRHNLHADLPVMLSTEGAAQAWAAPRGPPPTHGSGYLQSPSPYVPLWVPGVMKGTATLCSRAWCPFLLGFTPHLQRRQVCDLVSQGPDPVITSVHLQSRLQLDQLLVSASMVPASQTDLGALLR